MRKTIRERLAEVLLRDQYIGIRATELTHALDPKKKERWEGYGSLIGKTVRVWSRDSMSACVKHGVVCQDHSYGDYQVAADKR